MNFTSTYPHTQWTSNHLPVILKDAVDEVQRNTGAPHQLVLNSALAVISAAAQGHYNVRRPGNLVGPVSLYLLTIAASGERKTTIDSLFTKPIRDFESVQRSIAKLEEPAYLANLERWEAESQALKRVIANNAKKGVENQEDAVKKLAWLMANRPIKPHSRRMIFEDVTPAALKAGLAQWPSAVVFSDEGAKVMNGPFFEDLGLLNSIWSGSGLFVDRKNSDSLQILSPRLTISLMVQPGVFNNILSNNRGEQFRDIGMFARFLVTEPFSTQGTRFSNGTEPCWQKLGVFHDRIREILQATYDARLKSGESHQFATICMSSEAAVLWLDYGHNHAESRVAFGQPLYPVRDFAAKIGEQIARIAALLHLLGGDDDSEITGEEMRQAINLMDFYESEFLRIFGPKPEPLELPEYIQDAAVLREWLQTKYWNFGAQCVSKNQLRQNCPNALRGRGRFQRALDHLAQTGFINVFQASQAMGKKPRLFVSQAFAVPTDNWALEPIMRASAYHVPNRYI
jgi:hypothetical protein